MMLAGSVERFVLRGGQKGITVVAFAADTWGCRAEENDRDLSRTRLVRNVEREMSFWPDAEHKAS